MVRGAYPTGEQGELPAVLRAGRVVLLHRGDGTAGGDAGQRRGAGLFAGGVSGLPATLAVSGRCCRLWALKFGMKRSQLIKHLNAHGAFLLREGSSHSIYQLGHNKTQVPRHSEIVDELARKICKDLGIPFVR